MRESVVEWVDIGPVVVEEEIRAKVAYRRPNLLNTRKFVIVHFGVFTWTFVWEWWACFRLYPSKRTFVSFLLASESAMG